MKNHTKKHLGKFYSGIRYTGSRRCDLHPRINRKRDKFIIDVSYTGKRNIAMEKYKKVVFIQRVTADYRLKFFDILFRYFNKNRVKFQVYYSRPIEGEKSKYHQMLQGHI